MRLTYPALLSSLSSSSSLWFRLIRLIQPRLSQRQQLHRQSDQRPMPFQSKRRRLSWLTSFLPRSPARTSHAPRPTEAVAPKSTARCHRQPERALHSKLWLVFVQNWEGRESPLNQQESQLLVL